MQAPQVQSQIPNSVPSMDPRIAAIQQQHLMQIEQQKLAEQKAAEQAQAAEAARKAQEEQIAKAHTLPQVQSNSGRLNPNRKSIRVNAEVVKKAALASILKRPTQPEPEPEPIEAIRPAYVEELEHQLAGDMKKKDESSEMSELMAAELADDEITQNAAQIKVETQKQAAKQAQAAPVMPDEILQAIENASPAATNPNISGSPNIGGSPNINAG